MVLTVHHLQVSQSERIVWLCEELAIPYELKLYKRSPLLSPPAYLALHPMGAAPVITDGDITLAESNAITEYILNIYGDGKLVVQPGEKGYAEYLYWLHFANGTLQPAFGRAGTLVWAGVSEDNNIRSRVDNKVTQALQLVDNRLGETGAWLAGKEFTAADVMTVFTFTTMRKFVRVDLSRYGNILAYLQRVTKREGYRRAIENGDPELDLKELMGGPSPEPFSGLKR
ncbi:hypothetical protein LTR62_003119 [Meristemomyces frigidus]|uniref:glutathione transferase n=1 Tax=Meristemomyces frigidus TaxID=1508187 RepID=A0AAN7YS01_9PEZI|nr:hypothetical protein LTR62_003119 [Meristemomyces frigidus]